MINYSKIKADNPKAWQAFEAWIIKELETGKQVISAYSDQLHISNEGIFNDRNLYDFFDGAGLHGSVIIPIRMSFKASYGFLIRDSNLTGLSGSEIYNTRDEAESIGFTECFALLEKQLQEKE